MSSCCHDPTEPDKLDPRELTRAQMRYDELVRDLFTDDPEKVLLKLVNSSSVYLRELAALRADYPSVRLRAIQLLDKKSEAVLNQIIDKEPDSEFGQAAKHQIDHLDDDSGLLGRLFHSS
ncbi:hypothetical protein MGMO_79c00110 [Methyloglobulus morosus KoM1]|uniref:HEAT repeat domain-containing protein n=1 Tax=Methyloglobulus morosus KoM1 TaxID=1116472 RepID=V5C0F0_9GAMM|nr:hypothetical protein [Methyloglobulus morosus]ESS71982.1 hypothetical protein MGMO_79c00110 [Methyloglobulus morosus KoM1]